MNILLNYKIIVWMIKFLMYRLNYSKPTLTSEINLMIEPEINFRKPPKNIKIAVILILNILLAFLNDYIFSLIILKIYFYFIINIYKYIKYNSKSIFFSINY